MTDNVDPETRSRIMRAVRGRDTGPEMRLRRALRGIGIRGYRTHYQPWPARTHGTRSIDVAFPRRRVAVFVDGCFWHGCDDCGRWRRAPSTWVARIEANVARDRLVVRELEADGWTVVRFWEHGIADAGPYWAATIVAVELQLAALRRAIA